LSGVLNVTPSLWVFGIAWLVSNALFHFHL
jgi:hypothetical protein